MQEPPQEPTATGPDGPEVPETPAGPPVRVRGRKRRFAKRWSRRFSIIAIAIFASIVITFFTVDIGRITFFGKSIRTIAESRGSKYLNRPLHIGQVLAYVTPGKFEFRDVVIEGPSASDRPFFQAKRIIVDLPWWDLFRRDLDLEITITGWRMVVERSLDGQAHLPTLVQKSTGEKKPPSIKPRNLAVYCHDGEFIYDDHVTPWRVDGPNLDFQLVRAGNLNTYFGLAKFTRGLVQIQNFEPMHADFSTRFQLKGGLVDLKHIDLLTDGAETHLDGFVDFEHWPNQEYRIQSAVDFNRMRELFFNKAEFRLSGKGRFNGIFKIARDGKYDLSGLFKSDEAGFGWRNSEWRFNNLDGELQWNANHFVVQRADSDFLGGRMQMTYGLDPLGTPGGAPATLTANYTGVDLYLFTRQFGWTALEPEGRMRGRVTMQWQNGHFSETMEGQGTTAITAPNGVTLATPELPPTAPPLKPEPGQFVPFRPYGEFGLGGNTSYRFSWSTLDFDDSWVATPSAFVKFSGHARGGDVHVPFHVTSHDWQNSDRLFTAIMTNFNHPIGAIEVGGRGTFDGTLTKAFNAPRVEGKFRGDRMHAWGVTWGLASGDIAIENSYLDLVNARITYGENGSITTSGRYSLGYRSDGLDEISSKIHAENVPLLALRIAFTLKDWPVDGTLAAADLTLSGQYARPAGTGTMRIEQGMAWSEPFDFATGDLKFGGDGSVELSRVVVGKGEGKVTGTAKISWAEDNFFLSASSDGLPVQELATFRIEKAPLSGQLSFTARGSGNFETPTWEITDLRVPDLYAADEGVGALRARLRLVNQVLTFDEVAIRSDRLQVGCQGTIALTGLYDAALHCQFDQTSLDPYFKFVGRDLPFNRAVASGTIAATGPLLDTTRLSVTARVNNASLTLFDYELTNDQPIDLSFHDNTFWLDRVNFKGNSTQLQLKGQANLTARTVDIQASGKAALEVLHAFYPNLNSEGDADLQASFTGTFDAPELVGRADIVNGRVRPAGVPSLSNINGRITMSGGLISVEGVRATMGEGSVRFAGGIVLDGFRPSQFNLLATGDSMIMHYPPGLQSTVRADLKLIGPVTAPVLSGDVTVLRANYSLRFQPEKGYFSFFSGGGEEVLAGGAVSADVPTRSPITLAIRIRAPMMPLVDNRAAGAFIVGSANVDITGTLDQPIITGRVDVDHGDWSFSGNRYTLGGGSIDFSNPVKPDPFFDLTAETNVHAAGQNYHVTVRLTGTLDKFTPTLTSEPWLSEMQIVSLLMGEVPDVGAAELRALSSPQEEQARALGQVGFAILTSPVSASVGSALQKATTLNAQIVPLLGTESTLQSLNPTARIVLGRAISSRVYLTYSRTLSGTQNELILVEVAQSDMVSWVLSRNEDKTFALDFRIRYVVR